jgi:hypothetical protein
MRRLERKAAAAFGIFDEPIENALGGEIYEADCKADRRPPVRA